MPFHYRLQKILEIRIRKKEEQLQAVIRAQKEVYRIENLIEQNKEEIRQTRINMRTADPMMFEGFDKFLKHLYEKEEQLFIQKKEAEEKLEQEKELLKEREKEVNVLEKHKEHKREDYIKEQKDIELKMLNEIGSQKHFARSQEAKIESGEIWT